MLNTVLKGWNKVKNKIVIEKVVRKYDKKRTLFCERRPCLLVALDPGRQDWSSGNPEETGTWRFRKTSENFSLIQQT
jgi:hypothetical protein